MCNETGHSVVIALQNCKAVGPWGCRQRRIHGDVMEPCFIYCVAAIVVVPREDRHHGVLVLMEHAHDVFCVPHDRLHFRRGRVEWHVGADEHLPALRRGFCKGRVEPCDLLRRAGAVVGHEAMLLLREPREPVPPADAAEHVRIRGPHDLHGLVVAGLALVDTDQRMLEGVEKNGLPDATQVRRMEGGTIRAQPQIRRGQIRPPDVVQLVIANQVVPSLRVALAEGAEYGRHG
mmetsp:Transcript_7581/g.19297  ORF Transcript_7581/g.19297 Transcript_7581/m.19297 type:complete len:233 (+) Transcript_7581:296-994(+)